MGFDMKLVYAAVAVALCLAACNRADWSSDYSGEPVDYGPPQDPKEITSEVANLVRDSDPSQTKVGAFGRFLTVDYIGGGTLVSIAANTSQEVISRTVNGDVLNMQILEKTAVYHANSTTPEKMSRVFQFNWSLPTPTPTPAPAAVSEASALAAVSQMHATAAAAAEAIAATDLAKGARALFSRLSDSRALAAGAEPKMSFHGLRAWEDSAPPPERVRSAPNCLGIPQCRLRLRHVVFDIVSWEIPQGNRVHLELVTSPDIPQTIGLNMSPIQDIWQYIPGLMKSCISYLVAIGNDSRSKTLITECREVVSFAFDASQFTGPTDEATP